jgi:hypothetical protein
MQYPVAPDMSLRTCVNLVTPSFLHWSPTPAYEGDLHQHQPHNYTNMVVAKLWSNICAFECMHNDQVIYFQDKLL